MQYISYSRVGITSNAMNLNVHIDKVIDIALKVLHAHSGMVVAIGERD